jgi:hypothetical protein
MRSSSDGYDGGARLVETRDNVVMTRTFSKVYGLGGLRVGYGYAPREVIEVLTACGDRSTCRAWRWRGRRRRCATPDWVAEKLRVNADERARLTGGCASLASAATTAPRISFWPASPMRRRPMRRRAPEIPRHHRARAQKLRTCPIVSALRSDGRRTMTRC